MRLDLLEGAVVTHPQMPLANAMESIAGKLSPNSGENNVSLGKILGEYGVSTAGQPTDVRSPPFTLALASAHWEDSQQKTQKKFETYILASSGGKNEKERLEKAASRILEILKETQPGANIHVLTSANNALASPLSDHSEDMPGVHDPIRRHDPVRKIASYVDAELKKQGAPQQTQGQLILGFTTPANAWAAEAVNEFNRQWPTIDFSATQSKTQAQTSDKLEDKYENKLDDAVEKYCLTRGVSKLVPFDREEPGKDTPPGDWNIRLITDDKVLLQRADKKTFMLIDTTELEQALNKKPNKGQKLYLEFGEDGKLAKIQNRAIAKTAGNANKAKL